jgi:glycosyltransferase involved in cell wall biosynthesis
MKNINKPTLSIGISVYNEAETISALLESIFKQTADDYVLENIIVVCDGTTDGTDRIIKKFQKQYSLLQLRFDGKQKGKKARLEELFHENKSDYIAIFDGDVILGTPNTLDEMIKQFSAQDVGIVGLNNHPLIEKSFMSKLITTWSRVWYQARLMYKNGNNIHNVRGCGIALRKSFAVSVKFPKNVFSDAQYMYFYAQNNNLRFVFAKKAQILYRKPSTLTDYLSQHTRSGSDKDKLKYIFGPQVAAAYTIPSRYKYKALLYMILTDPFFTISSGLFYVISLVILKYHKQQKSTHTWQRVSSTKKAIAIPF